MRRSFLKLFSILLRYGESMNTPRWDETWHRLNEWTNGQTQSERLAAQIAISEGYSHIDPSHPLGGPDGGKDAVCFKDGKKWVMAVYFPRGKKNIENIKNKFLDDLRKNENQGFEGIVFVTNQEVKLSDRESMLQLSKEMKVDLLHLERLVAILDMPKMSETRRQFLNITSSEKSISQALAKIEEEARVTNKRLEGLQTGGDTFCYFMLYHFDLTALVAQNLAVIRVGEYPLYDVRIRLLDLDSGFEKFTTSWGEISAPAEYRPVKWKLDETCYYRIFFHARNGQWHQDLVLRKSSEANCWLASTVVVGRNGRGIIYQHTDSEFASIFGPAIWRQ
jgi:hypothetical protein